MPSAMIVVVGIDDQEDAYGTVAGDLAQTATFVGDPWPCSPTCDGDGYDTPGVIAQRTPTAGQEPGTCLDETDRVIAREGLTALLGMWASAREAFGPDVPDLVHADRIRDLIGRLS